MATQRTTELTKVFANANTAGPQYEYKVTGLINARLRRQQNIRYDVASNVKGVGPMDDVVIRIHWDEAGSPRLITYLLQLKHSHEAAAVTEKMLIEDKSKLCIKNFFQVYKTLIGLQNKMDRTENKSYFMECPVSDYRFILYTTKKVDHDTSAPQKDSDLFPYSELLSSKEKEIGFTFNQNDTGVWNLYNGKDEEEVYRTEFLPRLMVFDEQKKESEIDALIGEELKGYLNLEEEICQEVVSKYISFISKRSADKGDLKMFNEQTNEIEDIAMEEMNIKFWKDLLKFNIQFSTSACKNLSELIHNQRAVAMNVPGVMSGVRCLKLKQTLGSDPEACLLFLHHQPSQRMNGTLLNIFKRIYPRLHVIIDMDDDMKFELTEVKEICSNDEFKVIVVYSRGAVGEFGGTVFEAEDRWNLGQLDVESRERMLRCKVQLQSFHVELRLLRSAWPSLVEDVDGAMLCALLREDATLGSSANKATLKPPAHAERHDDEATYVSRRVMHRIMLSNEVLDLQTERFVLHACPKHLAEELKDRVDILSLQGDQRSLEEDLEKFKQKYSRSQGKNIHLITYDQDSIVWVKTCGDPINLIPHLNKLSSQCRNVPTCIHHEDSTDFSRWKTKTLLLSGEPGMGKTTFLSKIARVPSHVHQWWVFIPIIAHKRFLNELPKSEEIQEKHAVELLAEAVTADKSSSPQATRAFLKSCLLKSGRITVFLDGVDEVYLAFKEKTEKIVEIFANSAACRIWISCTNHVEEDMKKRFRFETLHLLPFTQEEEVKYIYRKIPQTLYRNDNEPLRQEVEQILNSLTDRNGFSLGQIPLHARELADAFSEIPKSRNLTLANLYKTLIEKKQKRYEEKFISEAADRKLPIVKGFSSYFSKVHEECALLIIPELEEFIDKEAIRKSQEEDPAFEGQDTGILRIKHTDPRFVHYSFVEYFSAVWLKRNFKPKMLTSVWEKFSPTMRHFLDSALAEGYPLHEAILVGNALPKILGDEVLDIDSGGRTLLHLAAIRGDDALCLRLLKAGCKAHVKDHILGWRALRYADYHQYIPVIEHLSGAVVKKKDIENTLKKNSSDGGLFRKAAETGYLNIVRFLIMAKDNVTTPVLIREKCTNEGAADSNGVTPLHRAAKFGHSEVVKELLEVGGARVGGQTKRGATALHLAAEAGHEHVVSELLAHGAPVDARDHKGYQPLHLAVEAGHLAVVRALLVTGSNPAESTASGWTPLHIASFFGHEAVAEALLAAGADVNAPGKGGARPLHHAAQKGYTAVLRLLLRHRAAVDATNARGHTPLLVASEKGHVRAVSDLLAGGASPQVSTACGWGALHYAAMHGRLHVAEVLLRAGARAEGRGRGGVTPLQLAERRGHQALCNLLRRNL